MSWISDILKSKLNVIVLGSDGMLGHDVYQHFTRLASQQNSCIGIVSGIDASDGIDVCNSNSLLSFFGQCVHYDICINCIAYTNTGDAEKTREGYRKSYTLNARAVKEIAKACKEFKMKLIHISTDYVFSEYAAAGDLTSSLDFGEMGHMISAFEPSSNEFPCNVYGQHKLIGELFIKAILPEKQYCIMRTSWLYGAHHHKSFVHKFMKNVVKAIQDGKTEVEMNDVERSMPTSTQMVVDQLDVVICNRKCGMFHAVGGSGEGAATRVRFAEAILEAFGKVEDDELHSKIAAMKVVPTHVETYQPKFSPMESSTPGTFNWVSYLNDFVSSHGKEILSWARAELLKQS